MPLFVDCMNISSNNYYKFYFSFIAFINIMCRLKIYLHQAMHMGFVFILKMFQDKYNRFCYRDYF